MAFQTLPLVTVALAGMAALGLGARQPAAAPVPAAPRTVHATAALTPANRYAEVCQVCHQATGLGVEGAFPPLAGSEWLNGPAIVPIAIVLKGLQGEITVKGKTYNSAMMAWEQALNDEDLAFTLTYARSQWGNKAAPITTAQVRAARARFASRTTPWTAAELRALR